MTFLSSTIVSGFGICIWDEFLGETVSGWPFLQSVLYTFISILAPVCILFPFLIVELHVACELYLGYLELWG